MNKHSASKKRPAKPSRDRGARKASRRKVSARPAARKPAQSTSRKATHTAQVAAQVAAQITAQVAGKVRVGQLSRSQVSVSLASASQLNIGTAAVSPVAALGSALRSHKFRVGQTVFYTSSPISRPGATGSYKVVRLLPSDGDDYQYRIKHAGEAFERVAKESQLELEA
jgi:hypothetical protein